MSFAIMRMEKLKSRASLFGALKHDTREKVPKNADPDRVKDNNYTSITQLALDKYTQKLPDKVRKNAVHAIELVLTASPEWFENATKKQVQEFVNRSRAWSYDLFGKKNELLFAMHMDEKTPHLHAIFMPLVDGKLNAKSLIGGSRNRMKELQDGFFEKVGRPLGMERGIARGSRHTQPKEFDRIMKEREDILENKEKAFEKAKDFWKEKLEKGVYDTGLYLGDVFHSLTKPQISECWAITKAYADKLREEKKQTQAPKKAPAQTKGKTR